jgi:hypothetical protein
MQYSTHIANYIASTERKAQLAHKYATDKEMLSNRFKTVTEPVETIPHPIVLIMVVVMGLIASL